IIAPRFDGARLAGFIGSIFVEEIVAAEKRQVALHVVDEAALEFVPGQRRARKAEIWNDQRDLRPAWDSLPCAFPASCDLFMEIVRLDRELDFGGVGDEGRDACFRCRPRIHAGGRTVLHEATET